MDQVCRGVGEWGSRDGVTPTPENYRGATAVSTQTAATGIRIREKPSGTRHGPPTFPDGISFLIHDKHGHRGHFVLAGLRRLVLASHPCDAVSCLSLSSVG